MGLINKLIELSAEITKKQGQVTKKKTVKNMIGFFGVKAGMGTSTIVANTAIVLASHEFNVCVIDFDLHYPVQYRLLGCKQSKIASFAKLLINTTLDVPEIYNDTMLPTLKLISANPTDSPNRFFDMDANALTRILQRTGELFDLVLIDFGGADIGYESTTGGMRLCDQLYTVITPNADILEGTFKIFNWLQEFKITAHDATIIQNMIIEDPIKSAKLKEFGFNHLLDLPMYSDIARLRYNDHLIIRSSIESKSADVWRAGILALANTIQEYSSADSYSMSKSTEVPTSEDENEVQTETEVQGSQKTSKLHAPRGMQVNRDTPKQNQEQEPSSAEAVQAEEEPQTVQTISIHAADLYATPTTTTEISSDKGVRATIMGANATEDAVAARLQNSAEQLQQTHNSQHRIKMPSRKEAGGFSLGTTEPPQFQVPADEGQPDGIDLNTVVPNLSTLERMFDGVEDPDTTGKTESDRAESSPDAAQQFDALFKKLT